MAWSTDKAYMAAKQLYSLWRNRFALSLRAHNKMQLICDRYEIDVKFEDQDKINSYILCLK